MTPEVAGIVATFCTAVAMAVVQWILNRRKSAADTVQVQALTAKTTTETAIALIEPLRREIEATRAEADDLRKELTLARQEAEGLRRELAAARAEASRTRDDLTAAIARIAVLEAELRAGAAEA